MEHKESLTSNIRHISNGANSENTIQVINAMPSGGDSIITLNDSSGRRLQPVTHLSNFAIQGSSLQNVSVQPGAQLQSFTLSPGSIVPTQCFLENEGEDGVLTLPLQFVPMVQDNTSITVPAHSPQLRNRSNHQPIILAKPDANSQMVQPQVVSLGPLVLSSEDNAGRTFTINSTPNNFNFSQFPVIGQKTIGYSHATQNESNEVFLHLEDEANLALPTVSTSDDGPSYSQFQIVNEPMILGTNDYTHFDGSVIVKSDTAEPSIEKTVKVEALKLEENFGDNIPDSQTITINTSIHNEEPQGPWFCRQCDITFDKWNAYKKHSKIHQEEKPFKCTECDARFNHEKNLKLHMATHNTENMECPECSKEFKRMASFKAHLSIHQEDEIVVCRICFEEFFSVNQLNEHQKIHDGTSSPKVITTETQAEGSPQSYKCEKCGQVFSKLLLYRNHMKLHKRLLKSASAKQRKKMSKNCKHRCNLCGTSFVKNSLLVRHMRIHTGERPFKCSFPGCKSSFNQKGTLVTHQSIHTNTRPYKCKLCQKSFVQKSNLRGHMERVHPLVVTSGKVFKCNECSCVFKKPNSLNAHISKHHSSETFVSYAKDSDDVKNLIQQVQDLHQDPEVLTSDIIKSFSGVNAPDIKTDILQEAIKNSGLTVAKDNEKFVDRSSHRLRITKLVDRVSDDNVRHYTVLIRIQNQIKWHICVFCTKEFKKPSDLVRHIRTHTNERPFKCPHCMKSFTTKNSLTNHMKLHSDVKQFSCTDCSKQFTTSASLRVHNWVHTGKRPYECSVCGKAFRTISQRKTHMLTHGPSAHKMHNLNKRNAPLPDIPLEEPLIMTNRGPVQQVARNHQVYANGPDAPADRPYKCQSCGGSFKKYSHLKQHERIHTGERPFQCETCSKTFATRSVLKSHERTHDGSRPYTCETCNRSFMSSGSLTRHLTIHSNDRPYICFYCRKTFKTNTTCKKHMKTHKQELAMEALRSSNHPARDITSDVMTSPLFNERNTKEIDKPIIVENSEEFLKNTVEMSIVEDKQDSIQVCSEPSSEIPIVLQPTDANLESPIQFQSNQIFQNDTVVVERQGVVDRFDNQPILHSIFNTAYDQELSEKQSPKPRQTVMTFSNSDQIIGNLTFENMEETYSPIAEEQTAQGNRKQTVRCKIVRPKWIKNTNDEDATETRILCSDLTTEIPNNTIDLSIPEVEEQDPFVEVINHMDLETTAQITQEEPRGDEDLVQSSSTFEQSSKKRPIANQETDRTRNESVKCGICSKTLKNARSLRSHMQNHKNAKQKNSCSLCNGTFPTALALKCHMRLIHSVRVCSVCDKHFPDSSQLLDHIRDFHKGEYKEGHEKLLMEASEKSIWRCPVCKALFRKAEEIQTHLTVHSAEEVSKAVTKDKREQIVVSAVENVVPNAGVQMDSNNSPIKIEESDASTKKVSQTLPNVCQTCGKGFKKKSDLVRHARIHTGEKPYECQICMKRFAVKSSLDVHARTHNKTKDFQCSDCGTFFSAKGSLKIHQRLHTGARPLKCTYCGEQFRTSGHRKAHMAKHFRLPTKNINPTRKSEPTAPETVDEPNDLYSVVFNDGSAIFEMQNGLNNVVDTALLNGQHLNVDESVLNELQLGNAVTLELPHNTDDQDAGHPSGILSDQRPIIDMGGNSIPHIVNLTDLSVVDSNNRVQCGLCIESFASISEWQEHLLQHNIMVKLSDGDIFEQENQKTDNQ